MAELVVEPGRVVTQEQFMFESAQHGVPSIAFDGYVHAAPFDASVDAVDGAKVRVINYDHHIGVDRATHPAACEQIMAGLSTGQLRDLLEDGELQARLVINDADHDASGSVNLGLHPWLLRGEGGKWVREQIALEGRLDRSFGIYPWGVRLEDLETNAWVFNAYNNARRAGEHMSTDPDVIRDIVIGVGERLKALHEGRAERGYLDMDYRVLDKGNGWTLIQDVGALARMGATRDGITAIISVRDQNPDRLDMNLCRINDNTSFDIPRITADLNVAEFARLKELGLVAIDAQEQTPGDAWGGTDDLVGSPRLRGTMLRVDEVCDIAGW